MTIEIATSNPVIATQRMFFNSLNDLKNKEKKLFIKYLLNYASVALCIIGAFTKSFNYTLSGMRKLYRKHLCFSFVGNSPSDNTLRTVFYSDCIVLNL